MKATKVVLKAAMTMNEYCEGCYMDGYEALADWQVFWRDPDLKGTVLRVPLCENCYKQWKVEFAKNKQGFRSKRIKRKRPFVFR